MKTNAPRNRSPLLPKTINTPGPEHPQQGNQQDDPARAGSQETAAATEDRRKPAHDNETEQSENSNRELSEPIQAKARSKPLKSCPSTQQPTGSDADHPADPRRTRDQHRRRPRAENTANDDNSGSKPIAEIHNQRPPTRSRQSESRRVDRAENDAGAENPESKPITGIHDSRPAVRSRRSQGQRVDPAENAPSDENSRSKPIAEIHDSRPTVRSKRSAPRRADPTETASGGEDSGSKPIAEIHDSRPPTRSS